jgi:O-antigen/teichoic acid export membrane protein
VAPAAGSSIEPADLAAGTGLTATLLLTGVAGGVGVVAGALTGRTELVALGLVLPLVCVQDLLRFVLFRMHRPDMAALIDATWAAASVAAWPLLIARGSATVATVATVAIVAWGLGALPGVLIGAVATRAVPTAAGRALRWWWTQARPLGGYLAIDTLVHTAAVQLGLVAIAVIAGTAALGELRAAQIVFGPVSMTLTALGMFVLPRIAGLSAERLRRLLVPLSGAAVGLAAAAALVLWLAGPLLYRLLYGESIAASTPLIVAVGALAVLSALPSGPVLVLKALRVGAPLAKGQLLAALTGLPAVAAAATLGIAPAAWALSVDEITYNLVIWPAARRALAERIGTPPLPEPAPAATS